MENTYEASTSVTSAIDSNCILLELNDSDLKAAALQLEDLTFSHLDFVIDHTGAREEEIVDNFDFVLNQRKARGEKSVNSLFPGRPSQKVSDSIKDILNNLLNIKILKPLSIQRLHGAAPPEGVSKCEWFCTFNPFAGCRNSTRGYNWISSSQLAEYQRTFNIEITLSAEEKSEAEAYLSLVRESFKEFEKSGKSKKNSKRVRKVLKKSKTSINSGSEGEHLCLIPLTDLADIKTAKEYIRKVISLVGYSDPELVCPTLLGRKEVILFACPNHFPPLSFILSTQQSKLKKGVFDNCFKALTNRSDSEFLLNFPGNSKLADPGTDESFHAQVKKCFGFYSQLEKRWTEKLNMPGGDKAYHNLDSLLAQTEQEVSAELSLNSSSGSIGGPRRRRKPPAPKLTILATGRTTRAGSTRASPAQSGNQAETSIFLSNEVSVGFGQDVPGQRYILIIYLFFVFILYFKLIHDLKQKCWIFVF
jgi:hypothetical protein